MYKAKKMLTVKHFSFLTSHFSFKITIFASAFEQVIIEKLPIWLSW